MLIKSPQEIALLRKGGEVLADVLNEVIAAVRSGVSTGELGRIAEEAIVRRGARPAFKGYRQMGSPPFPSALCTSLNDEVVHGIPKDDRIIQEGDLVKLDIGAWYKNLATDMARTVAVGVVSGEARRLSQATRECLDAGLSAVRAGAKLSDYTRAVEKVLKRYGFSAVRDLVGHGVGHEVHEMPQIPNYGGSGLPNFTFQEGMVLAFEPMVNVRSGAVKMDGDGWTFRSADGSLSAHFEDTVVVTKEGMEILTTEQGTQSMETR